MAANYLATIPKLQGRDNYEEWSFAMENFLILEGLNKCIDGTESDSVLVQKAKAKIILSLDPSLYVHVRDAVTAKDVWDKLKEFYANKSFTRKIGLLRNLTSLKLENCSNMEEYVSQTMEISQKLDKTGLKLGTELVGSLLLAGLPERYSPMVMAIEHSGIPITSDVIKTKLLDMQDDSSSTTASAFTSRMSNRTKRQNKYNRSKSDKDKNDVICFKCKKPGHYMSKCPNLNKSGQNKSDVKNAFNVAFLSTKFSDKDWYLDSGASIHLTCRQDWLTNSRQPSLKEIVVADSTVMPVQNCGEIQISTKVDKEHFVIEIKNAQYVPNLTTNLLSVSELLKNGNTVNFDNNGCRIFNQKGVLVGMATLINGVYKLNCTEMCLFTGKTIATTETWHKRLGHINYNYLNKMKDGLVNGVDFSDKVTIQTKNCEVCCEGKQSRQPFGHSGNRAAGLLEVVHSDLAGPMETTSIGGSKYFVQFQDDFSRLSFIYFLKTKDETLEKFKEFQYLAEKQTGKKVKLLRTDNGGEYMNTEFENYLKKEGIIHQTTNPYCPEQNGTAERLNRTIIEKARCLLFEAGLEKRFWAEAVNTACYLRNRSAVSNIPKTPYEIFFGRKPDLSHIRIFGSTAMTHIPKEKRRKWDKKSTKSILVGYSETTKGYRLYNPETNKITTSRDVHVIEPKSRYDDINFYVEQNPTEESPEDSAIGDPDELSLDEQAPSEEVTNVSIPENPRRSERKRKPKVFEDFVTYFAPETEETLVSVGDPNSTKEVFSSPERQEWIKAMKSELKSFNDNCAWDLVDLPKGQTVVKCKWVYKKKWNSEGNLTYRARLVAKGFSQKPGIDYDETFSPVVRHSSLRLLLALSVQLDLETIHLDVVTAFLNGKLEETVYMEIPEGFCDEIAGNMQNKALKLNKAIYGLKQSSRVWYKEVEVLLISLNYKKSDYEPCIFIKRDNDSTTIIALYVDDFFIFSDSKHETNFLKEQLALKFKIKDLGQMKQCLGMRIRKDKDELLLDQQKYIDQILRCFNMDQCKPASTPLDKSIIFDQASSVKCNKELPY